MVRINKIIYSASLIAGIALVAVSCKKDQAQTPADTFDTSGTFTQKDQMGRPAINTVFMSAAQKDQFNMTPPSMMPGIFMQTIVDKLTAFGYTQNALGQDKNTFAGLLSSDVLNVKTSGTTTFFDGTNVLTGRALGDDVIDTELLLIFGGPTGMSNPGLTSDHVNGNDKVFLTQFPYLATPW